MSGQILIVDDHEIVRRGLRSLLSSRPEWQICGEAADGLEAVEKAKSLRPSVVLMDISMPRMDGLEAARIIRRDLPQTSVIIISQNDSGIARRQAQEVDAAAHIDKNHLSQELLPTVSRLLDKGKAGSVSAPEPATSAPDWLAGGGELSRLIRNHDWSRTSLGPLETWPQSLKTSVNLILNARHPMWVGWGKDVAFLYNDAYIQVLSLAKHPWALGKPTAEVWPEIWDICGPLVDKVFEKGEASFLDDVRFLMNRGDFLEETYYSFSYSPIRDESGTVAGLFCPSTEVTPKVINARRLGTISDLSATALIQKTTDTACASVAATLSKNPDDIPFAVLYLIDPESRQARLERTCRLSKGLGGLTPLSIELETESAQPCLWPVAEVVKTGRSQAVSVKDVDGLPLGVAQQRLSQAMVLPVTSRGEGGTVGVLVAGVNPARKLDAEYRTFYELVAGQIATAIQNARAAEDERQRLEALAEIDRAKTTFFSNVSHEFRTPLTLMLGPVEDLLAKSHTGLSPAAKSQLELVNRNGSRLLRLVNTLLDFSRIEAGRMQAIFLPTDLGAFTIELASVFRSATEKAGLRLELDCPKFKEPVFVDRGMWEKIVLNLISNAFKFTFDGKIAVALVPAGNNVELRVSDTGVGIPAQEIPRLFDRFHRIENTRSRTHEGSGIGLALVQELVKLHGGSVRVESVLGEGSTFIVSIPLGSAHLPADRIGGTRTLASTALGAAPYVEEALRWLPDSNGAETVDEIAPADELIPVPCPPLAAGDAPSLKRPRILLADDNSDMRQYLVRLLAERYEVQAVPDGQAALAAVRERLPDLVLTDVMMPNLDGFGLLRELRSDPKTRTIPIILLSARAGEECRVEGMEHGADDYLIKPFSARELLARVQTHLQMSRVRREAADALQQRTAQFETLLNAAPLGVYMVDADLQIRAMNPTAISAFGNIPDPVGQDFDEVIHILWPKGYADEIVRRFRHTLETGEPYVVPEWAEERRDRKAIEYYEWRINRIPLPDGRNGVVCYFRDISRQVHARQAIAESEQRLRLATEAAELGIWHWYPQEDRVTWENERPYKIYGRTREEGPINGAEFREHYCHPDDLPAFESALSRTLETGARFFFQCRVFRPSKHGSKNNRDRGENKDKNNRRTLIWVEFTAQLEYSSAGSRSRLLGTVQDITERKQAEETVRQSEERLRLAQKAGHSGTWEWNLQTDQLITSPELQELFGLNPDVASHDSEQFRAVVHPEDLPNIDKALADAIETDGKHHFEFRITRADGAQRWLESTGQVFYDENGKPLRIIGVTTDITERKRSEEILQQHRQRFDLVAEAAQVGFWFCDLPFDKLIWDNRVKEHFWLPPDSNVTIETFYERLHPGDRERTRQAIAESNANDTPYDIEYRTVSPDGREKWIRALGRTFYDAAGQPKSFDGLTLDITERKQIEERERQLTAEAVAATAKFRAVFEQTTVFAGIMTLDGIVIDANRLCLEACGYRPEEVIGRNFWECGWWRNFQESRDKIRAATALAAQGTPYRETLLYSWADGTERIVDFALYPILDHQGQILFLHPTGVDITDLKRVEAELRKSHDELEQRVEERTEALVASLASLESEIERRKTTEHVLRELSARSLRLQDEERRRIARELHDSTGQTLVGLKMMLSSLGKLVAKVPRASDMIFELDSLAEQALREIRVTSHLLHPPLLDEVGFSSAAQWYLEGFTKRSGIKANLELAATPRLTKDGELVFFRILQESLTNVLRHSGSSAVDIRVSSDEENAILSIKDYGTGIPLDKLESFQETGAGVGVGLGGMKQRVRNLGGHLTVRSDHAGTCIIATLPLANAETADAETSHAQPSPAESSTLSSATPTNLAS